MTELLLESAGQVLAIEMDARLVEFLRERFTTLTPSLSHPMGEGGRRPGEGKPALSLIHADALEFIRREPRDWRHWKLVANLPYSVASPILVELAQSLQRPERLVATLQLEVAQRLMAQADDDDYGVLTLLVQLAYEPRASFKIPSDCFFPVPEVDSKCVILQRRAIPLLAEEKRAAFVKIVKRGFSQRRKMMLKLLKQDWPSDKLAAALCGLGNFAAGTGGKTVPRPIRRLDRKTFELQMSEEIFDIVNDQDEVIGQLPRPRGSSATDTNIARCMCWFLARMGAFFCKNAR